MVVDKKWSKMILMTKCRFEEGFPLFPLEIDIGRWSPLINYNIPQHSDLILGLCCTCLYVRLGSKFRVKKNLASSKIGQ